MDREHSAPAGRPPSASVGADLPSDARYLRHLIIPELGEAGQGKLRAARVAVVGAGGLGSPVLFYLAAAGVGRLGIVDSERVELSNLQRQVIHSTSDIGRLKTESAAEKLTALNPEVEVVRHTMHVDPETAGALVAAYDVVVIAVDNLEARYALNDACVKVGNVLVEGAIVNFTGSVMTILGGVSACYRCLHPQAPAIDPQEAGRPLGVFGPLPGVIGALQAAEVIKVITGIGRPLTNRMLWVDALEMTFEEIAVTREPRCPVCGEHATVGH